MKSTNTVAVSIHAVFAPSIFGGSAAKASGTWARNSPGRILFIGPPPLAATLTKKPKRVRPLFSVFSAGHDVLGVEAEGTPAAVGEPVPQRRGHGAERDLLPGDRRFFVQRDFEGLLARLEVEVEQARAVEEVHLVDVGDRDEREGLAELEARPGLFERLARRGRGGGLAVLHEARRQRPVTVARLDRAAAEQDPSRVLGDRAYDHDRVLVVDHPARVAQPARQAVARRHAARERRGAVRAEFHPGARRPGRAGTRAGRAGRASG